MSRVDAQRRLDASYAGFRRVPTEGRALPGQHGPHEPWLR